MAFIGVSIGAITIGAGFGYFMAEVYIPWRWPRIPCRLELASCTKQRGDGKHPCGHPRNKEWYEREKYCLRENDKCRLPSDWLKKCTDNNAFGAKGKLPDFPVQVTTQTTPEPDAQTTPEPDAQIPET